jgi:hypothetical protein
MFGSRSLRRIFESVKGDKKGRGILHNEELSDFCTPSIVKVAKNETKRTCSMHTTFYWI